jgi:hypothetical protein
VAKAATCFSSFDCNSDTFRGESNDLILLSYFAFPSSIFGHVVVPFDDFTINVQCSPFVWVAAKVSVSNDTDFSFEALYFD